MKELADFFKDKNGVNEDVVMGSLFFVCGTIAGFVPAVPAYVFYTFIGGCLTFFGKKLTTDILNAK